MSANDSTSGQRRGAPHPTIRQFTPSDAEALVRHAATVGYGYSREDWLSFLEAGTVLGHVADEGILSSAALSRSDGSLGWLGAFIVNPSHQGRGLGKNLLAECLRLVPDGHFRLGLVSTKEAEKLYASAGFVTVETTHKLVTDAGFTVPLHRAPEGWSIRALVPDDWRPVLRLDGTGVDGDRSRLLRHRAKHAAKNLVAINPEGALEGFILGASEPDRLILGPLHAPSTEVALALISQLCAEIPGATRIDVRSQSTELIAALTADGFRLERVCPVMSRSGQPLRFSANYRALTSQAFG